MNFASEGHCGFLSRRGFLKICVSTVAAAGLSACKEWWSVGHEPEARQRTPYIIANDDFYMVAVDTSFRPSVTLEDANSVWSLPVHGLDGAVAQRLSYTDLVNSASRVVPYTFECIGNPVGGQLIGNARWHIVPLRDILKKAISGSTNVRAVMFEGLDDFYSSVSVQRAMDDYAFIAMKMNSEPLPPAHGFPARVILPDLYGMKQPRWLRKISLLEGAATTSYWEKRGWAGEVPVKTMSRLDPRPPLNANESTELTGIAFAGARGIQKVEVSLDNGATWQTCKLVSAAQPHVWTLWQYQWPSPAPGKYSVKVRAVDGRGILQTGEEQGRFPDGASGYDAESIVVQSL